jgi:transposase-like protein
MMSKKKKTPTEYVETFESGDWIYPSLMCRCLHLKDVAEAYAVLNDFCAKGIVTQYISIHCPYCGRVYGQYKTISDVPERIMCPKCRTRLRMEHGEIIYRKN